MSSGNSFGHLCRITTWGGSHGGQICARASARCRAALFILVASLSNASVAADKAITFHEQIEPLLQKHCQDCHHRGGNAPFSLETCADAQRKAKTISKLVSARQMPPWPASPRFGKFANDNSLTDQEIAAIVRWVESGAREGKRALAPPPRRFASDWSIGAPDATFTTAEFTVPAEGKIDYRYVRVRNDSPEDRWVEAFQIRSTAPELVHHVLIFLENVPPPPKGTKRPWRPPFNPFDLLEGAKPEEYGEWIFRFRDYIARDLPVGNGGGMNGYFATTLGGGLPTIYPAARARLLPAGATLVFQIHYTPNGKPQTSQTTLAVRFAKQPPREPIDTRSIATVAFRIPPDSKDHVIQATNRFRRDALLLSLQPHMHLRGKSFRFVAEFPDGRSETLLEVPRWDFNWQLSYLLAQPRRLPRGTVLRAIATYDNSPDNPSNPDPAKEVYFGLQSEDEMMIGYYDVIWLEPAKENSAGAQ